MAFFARVLGPRWHSVVGFPGAGEESPKLLETPIRICPQFGSNLVARSIGANHWQQRLATPLARYWGLTLACKWTKTVCNRAKFWGNKLLCAPFNVGTRKLANTSAEESANAGAPFGRCLIGSKRRVACRREVSESSCQRRLS
jgi:hypothetical protein